MSTPWILHRLYSLDTSSPDFLRSLYSLFRHDEEERHLTNLRGTGLAGRFSQRGMYPPFHQLTKQTPQVLGVISTNRDVSRQCLRKLQAICGHRLEQSPRLNRSQNLRLHQQNDHASVRLCAVL